VSLEKLHRKFIASALAVQVCYASLIAEIKVTSTVPMLLPMFLSSRFGVEIEVSEVYGLPNSG
jgi:hypothetical protein